MNKQDDFVTHDHLHIRSALRMIGPIVLAVGVLCIVTASFDFFSKASSHQQPTLFWLYFIGLPLLPIGFALTMHGYMGALMRYQAREGAPIATDTINYMGSATQPGIASVAAAVASGMARGVLADQVVCSACGAANDSDARYCDACGKPLQAEKKCAACETKNDDSAKFCDSCGASL